MALTPSRWIAIALLGFVMAPVLVFTRPAADSYRWSDRERLQNRAGRAQARLRAAAERLRTDRLIDSIARSVPATPAASIRITFDRLLDTTTRRRLVDLSNGATSDRPAPRVGTDIAFVVDSVQMIDGVQRRGFSGAMSLNYILPRRGTTDRCIVVARVKPWGVNEFVSEASRDRLLGPCGFYERFGVPGIEIERWLGRGAWGFAQNSSPNWGRWNEEWATPYGYPLRMVLGPRGVACAKGSDSSCLDALQTPAMGGWRPRNGRLTTEFNPYIMSSSWYSRDWSFGPRSPSLLADLAKDLGTDRFTRFWQSEQHPESAFRAATGTELSEWGHQWVVRNYHAEPAGPGVSGAAWAWGLAMLALSLGVILRSSERRQMA